MSNGASGDINNIDFDRKRPPRAPFEQVRVVATKMATAAWIAVKGIETYHDNPIIAVRQRVVELRYRIPTEIETMGGAWETAVKKLNGARLTWAAALMVLTHAMGRGTMVPTMRR